jgi:hypothetical protein
VLNGRFKGGHITRHYGNPATTSMPCNWSWRRAPTWKSSSRFRYREDLAQPTQVVLQAAAWGRARGLREARCVAELRGAQSAIQVYDAHGQVYESSHTECAMQTLYPQIKPYARHDLAVEAPHAVCR